MLIDAMIVHEFMVGALFLAKEQGYVWDKADIDDIRLKRIVDTWGGKKELSLYPNIDAALSDFRQKLQAKRNKLDEALTLDVQEIKINTLAVTVTIPLGNGKEVQFLASGTIPDESTPDDKKYYYGKLFASAFQGVNEFKKNPPPQLNPAQTYTATGDTATGTFEFHTIEMESKAGKRYFNVKGDAFPIHGVPIYHEVLAKAGIASENLKEINTVIGIATYVKNAKGEAHKVVHLQVNS